MQPQEGSCGSKVLKTAKMVTSEDDVMTYVVKTKPLRGR